MQQQPSIKLVEMCGERPTERIKRRDTSTSNTTFCANPFEGRTSRVLFVTSTISERISVLPAQYSAITRLRSMLCSMSRVEAREAASCSECHLRPSHARLGGYTPLCCGFSRIFSLFVPKSIRCSFLISNTRRSISFVLEVTLYLPCFSINSALTASEPSESRFLYFR